MKKITKIGLILVMFIGMSACTDSGKPTTVVTLEQIQVDALDMSFIQAKFEKIVSIDVISQPVQGKQCLVVANMVYDNGEALVKGEVVINYEWVKKAWTAVNTQFSYQSVSVKAEADPQKVLDAAGDIDVLNSKFQANAFTQTPVLVSKELNLEIGEATYVVTRGNASSGWTATTTYTIKGKYYYLDGWQFTIEDWSYKEVTKWAGSWQIVWGSSPTESQYTAGEIMKLTVSGDISLSLNKADIQEEKRDVNVAFIRNRSPYSIPVTLSKDYQDEGLYTSRFILTKYGNQSNDQFNLELHFENSGSGWVATTIAKSFDGTIGTLTKIK
ncbi:MAG: hypothetical protein HGB31_08250 [Erysipelotrichaceae bacterium]|nr:hypothetical protein [Erysipelotrichaceae bacterium]